MQPRGLESLCAVSSIDLGFSSAFQKNIKTVSSKAFLTELIFLLSPLWQSTWRIPKFLKRVRLFRCSLNQYSGPFSGCTGGTIPVQETVPMYCPTPGQQSGTTKSTSWPEVSTVIEKGTVPPLNVFVVATQDVGEHEPLMQG